MGGVAMKRGPEWLLDELPRMQQRGVVDAATAEGLRAYCAEHARPGRSWTRPLLGAFGALLVGFGVVLLVAHNWDGMSLAARMTMTFAPLLGGQLACLWALTGARGSRLWREGAGAFTVLAFAAALALVGQIYHLGGDLDRFLLTCTVVAMPLAYLLRSHAVLVLCALGLLAWVMAAGRAPPFAVAGAYALLAPLLWWARQVDEAIIGQLAMVLTIPLATAAMAASLGGTDAPEAAVLWIGLAIGTAWLARNADGRALIGPVSWLGSTGLVLIGAAATFGDFWAAGGWLELVSASAQTWIVLLAAMSIFFMLLGRALRRRWWFAVAGAVPVFWLIAAMLLEFPAWGRGVAMTLANGYALAIGLVLVHLGLKRTQLRMAHAGLVIVGALVLMRFFDAALPFTVRGLAFVAIGVAFMAASAWLQRRVARR